MQKQQQFFIQQTLLLILTFIALIWIFPVGGNIDIAIISPWIDRSGKFPFKDNWYLSKLSHNYVKYIVIAVYASFFIAWLTTFKKNSPLKNRRMEFGYFFFVSMLCTISIGFIKSHSAHACPWDMTTETSLGFIWNFNSVNGHCFPGGHASSGFALMTGYFVYRKTNINRAYFFLISGLLLGFAMGWAQMMRGAHFLSHNLWTVWIIWLINIFIYLILIVKNKQNPTKMTSISSTYPSN